MLSQLFSAVLCTTVIHSHKHTHIGFCVLFLPSASLRSVAELF